MNINHPIDNLLKNTMESLKSIIDVDTIIGNPITTDDGATIIPVSKVCLGFASAGSEFSTEADKEKENNEYPFGGGSGAGLSVKPVAFLVLKENSCKIIPLTSDNPAERLIDSIPQLIELLKDNCKKDSCKKEKNAKEHNNIHKE